MGKHSAPLMLDPEFVVKLLAWADFYHPVIKQIAVMEDDGGPVFDEEERRHKCQSIC